jgi:hypothetical protein
MHYALAQLSLGRDPEPAAIVFVAAGIRHTRHQYGTVPYPTCYVLPAAFRGRYFWSRPVAKLCVRSLRTKVSFVRLPLEFWRGYDLI